jgi:hypothetical protein
MFKRAVRNLAIVLLFAASIIPVKRAFTPGLASRGPVIVAVSGGDPEPPGVVRSILAFLGLS